MKFCVEMPVPEIFGEPDFGSCRCNITPHFVWDSTTAISVLTADWNMHVGFFRQFALHLCTRSCRILRQWNAGRFKLHWKPICRTDRHLGLNNSFLKQSYQCFFILYLSVNNADLTSSALPLPYHKTVRCSSDLPFPHWSLQCEICCFLSGFLRYEAV